MQESHKIAREKLVTRKIKSKQGYDKKENSIDIHVKDLILLKDNTARNKLESLWIGPYEVIDIIGEENIVIQRGRRGVTVHKNNVKKYFNENINLKKKKI
uniref:Retrovirus-related Pol polyprotein n=1 Tax=Sipha flava TaxID=143950 RepID=A0A2S2PZ82_9HEMI